LGIIKDDWKFIEPGNGSPYNPFVNIELGNSPEPQLYNLKADPGEKNNVAKENPLITEELSKLLEKIKNKLN
jgi:hypothetical protein